MSISRTLDGIRMIDLLSLAKSSTNITMAIVEGLAEGGFLLRHPQYDNRIAHELMMMRDSYWHQRFSELKKDLRKGIGAQSGLMLPVETPRDITERVQAIGADSAAIPLSYWPNPFLRFFDLDDYPFSDAESRFQPEHVVPAAFARRWRPTGLAQLKQCHIAVNTIWMHIGMYFDISPAVLGELIDGHSIMSSTGASLHGEHFGMETFAPETLTRFSKRYSVEPGAVITGPHADLNSISVHFAPKNGEGSFFVLMQDKSVVCVEIPDGWVFVHAGLALELFSGGYFPATIHWATVSDTMMTAIERARENREQLWRTTFNAFLSPRLDYVLRVHPRFLNDDRSSFFPPKSFGQLLSEVISATGQGAA